MRKNTKTRVKKSSNAARSKPTRAPKVEPAARKQAILDAALTEFSQCGFEAARLDDIADRAGIAKGTLYLYFDDKESLFEEVVRSAVLPVLERLSAIATAPDLPVDKISRSLVFGVRKGGPGDQAEALNSPHHC